MLNKGTTTTTTTEKDIKMIRQEKTVKFMANYAQIFAESDLINLESHYNEFISRLDENLATLKECLKRKSQNSKLILEEEDDDDVKNLPKSPKIIQILTEKFKTPIFDKRRQPMFSESTVKAKQTTTQQSQPQSECESIAPKKRTANAANISILNEEENNEVQPLTTETKGEETDNKKTKRGRKPKAQKNEKTKGTKKKETIEEQNDVDEVKNNDAKQQQEQEQQQPNDIKQEEVTKQPQSRASKKLRLNEKGESKPSEQLPQTSTDVAASEKNTDARSSENEDNQPAEKKKGRPKKVKKGKASTKEEEQIETKQEATPQKAPPIVIASAIKSTVKPMTRTRRAAKEAEAKRSVAAKNMAPAHKTPKPEGRFGMGSVRVSVVETNASKHPMAANLISVNQSAKKSVTLARKSIMTAKMSLLHSKTPMSVRKQSIGLLKSALKNKAQESAYINRVTSTIQKKKDSLKKLKTKKKSETQVKAFQKSSKEDTSIVQLVRIMQPTSTPAQFSAIKKKPDIAFPKISMVKIAHEESMDTDSPDNLIDETITSSAPMMAELLATEELTAKEQIVRQETNDKEKKAVVEEKCIETVVEARVEKSIAHLKSPMREVARLSIKSECRVHVVRLPSTNSEKLSSENMTEVQKDQEERLSAQLKPFKALNESVYQNPQPQQSTIIQQNRIMKPKLVSTSSIKTINTPSKIPQYSSVTNLMGTSSVIKFTTPLKSASELEQERRRKNELLAAKEAKERERLAELERQKQEKRDEIKKKREEKHKKVFEKKESEREQKTREIEKKTATNVLVPQPTLIKPSTSNFTLSGLQPTLIMPSVNFQKKTSIVLNPLTKQPMHEKKDSIIPMKKSIQPVQPMTRNLENTYVLESSPPKPVINPKPVNMLPNFNINSYDVTPLQPQSNKLKDPDNYDVSDLNSEESDDDDDPKKPIPYWAQDSNIMNLSQQQQISCLNFTKMFKAATRIDIDLDRIFKNKKNKNYQARSSSAIWNVPPIWNTSGISGDGSFMSICRK